MESDEVAVGLKSRGKVLKPSLQKRARNDETSSSENDSEDEVESNEVVVGLKSRGGKVLSPQKKRITLRVGCGKDPSPRPPLTTTPRQSSSPSNNSSSSSSNDPSSSSPSSSSSSDDDDDDNDDDNEEEEKMGGQSDILISVQLIPLFQFHCQLDDKLHYQPNTKTCKLNVRGLEISRMTCMDPQDNMPSEQRSRMPTSRL